MNTNLSAVLDHAFDPSADAAFAKLHVLDGDKGNCGGAWLALSRAKAGRRSSRP